jgi:hypothetical protein
MGGIGYAILSVMLNTKVLSTELNHKLLKLAPKFTPAIIAPDTFESLARASVGGLVVYSGASDSTIYGDAKVNWAFRAWHDSLHLKLGADFTLIGELRVGLEQARILGGSYGDIVMAEVKGQIDYYNLHGSFPLNQIEFVLSYLKGVKHA